jgi:energy-coupling factor transporter ATP-binding protein EcfA2
MPPRVTSYACIGRGGVNLDTGLATRYFPHYEAQEEAFRRRIATLLPRIHAGTEVFWRDFQQVFQTMAELADDRRELYITSNPRDCLAFGTPRQVLQAAIMTAAPAGRAADGDLQTVAARFGLARHLAQPVRSLSGGETVRLALAKAYIGAARADRLTLASPFSWLSLGNRRFFHDLASRCRDLGRPLEIFALEGEDATTPCDEHGVFEAGPAFRIGLRGARVVLNSFLDRLHNRRLAAVISDGDFRLQSPCLIQGDNGQGKSLLAKALAGAMPREGEAGLAVGGRTGRVRLLLQDLVSQTMMRSFPQLAAGNDAEAMRAVGRIYDAIRAQMRVACDLAPDEVRPFERGRSAGKPATLAELKILMAARRLAASPAAIVLDEPDWGLRQAVALALVRGIIRAAHAAGVAVLLISHKPWWQGWAASGLVVCKAPPAAPEATDLFQIQIQRDLPCS